MAQLLDSGLFSLIATNSAIGVGWTLTFYVKGTSTLTNTYPTEADANAGTNANANPITIGADGRIPAIWVTAQVKCIMKDASGITKATKDPVNDGGSIALTTNLAASSGSSLVGFIQSGTGAVARTVQAKERDSINAADFGYVADDSTDNYAALQAAVNAANGREVIIPAGRGRISAPITSSVPVNIRGIAGPQTGPGAAEQYDTTSSTIVCNFANPSAFIITSKRGSIFRDFKLDVATGFRPPASGAGIYLTAPAGATCAKAEIHNVTINQFYQCIKFTRPNYHRVTGCYFGSWVQDAIYSETDSASVEGSTGYIENNYFFGDTGSGQRSCIYLGNGYAFVRSNEILGAQVGVRINVANYDAGTIRIYQNTIEEQYYYGVAVFTTGNKNITMMDISYNEFSIVDNGANMLASVFIDDNGGTNYIQSLGIVGNTTRNSITGANKKHFSIGNGLNVTVSRNIVEELGAATPFAFNINGTVSNAGLGAPFIVADNICKGTVTKYSLAAAASAQVIDYQGVTFANLPANAANGSMIYCSDGTFANPVAAAGTGCYAKRLNGAWRGD